MPKPEHPGRVRALVFAVAVSASLNLALLCRERATAPPVAPTPAAAAVGGVAPAATWDAGSEAPEAPRDDRELAAARERLRALDAELAGTRERLARLGQTDASDLIGRSTAPLRTKLKALSALADPCVMETVMRLSRELMFDPRKMEEALSLLGEETDPQVLARLGDLIAMGALLNLPADALPRLHAALAPEGPVERRIAAAWGEGTVMAAESSAGWAETMAAAIRSEPDSRVLEALAKALNVGSGRALPADLITAVEGAIGRLPAGDGRVYAYLALAKSSLAVDNGSAIHAQWLAADTADRRDEIALAVARSGLEEPPRSDGAAARVAPAPFAELRARFLSLYEGTRPAETRRQLAVAAGLGLGLLGAPGAGAARFVRDIAAREGEPQVRTGLLRLAEAVAAGQLPERVELGRMLSGKE